MRIDGVSQCALIGRAALVRFAALYGIIITDIGEGGNTLAAACLEHA